MLEDKWHNIKDTPLPKLLHTISLRHDETSALEFTRGTMKRRIYFQKGWPVHVVSNSMSDVLGRVMIEQGIISEENYKQSIETTLKEKKRHGEVLISMGIISQKELDECLVLQMKKKLWRILNWTDGNYKYFLVESGLPAMLHVMPLNPDFVIISGILNGYYSFERVEAELKKFVDIPLIVSSDKSYKIADLGLNTQQGHFLSGFDGTNKTKDIIDHSYLLRREAELLLYALIITGIIAPKDKAVDLKETPVQTLKYEMDEEYIEKKAKEEASSGAQNMNAELIFQNGKNHLASKDYEKAAAAFEEIVKLKSDEAEYKAYLGWALFNTKTENSKRGKVLLLGSISANPDLDIAHIFLAKLYRKEDLLQEAEKELTTVLGKNPFLPEARKELTLMKMRSNSPREKKGYISYFHLTKNPFDPLPDPDFLYLGDAHSETLHFLVNGIKNGKSNIIVLLGEQGSGKTTLCLQTMNKLAAKKIAFAYVDSPAQSGMDILIATKTALGMKNASNFSEDVFSALREHVSTSSEVKGRTVVILDNAHYLNATALMAIKSLLQSGIDTIVISGRPEIEGILNEPNLRDIKQNISGIHHMHPFSLEETKKYIFKRLASAGDEGKLQITPWAVKTIYHNSFGNPEITNKICDNALALACDRTNIIDEQIVKAVEASTRGAAAERLPQIEPVEGRVEQTSEEKIKKIIDEQVAEVVEDAVRKEFETRRAQLDKAAEKAEELFEQKTKQLIDEHILQAVEDAVKKEFAGREAQPDAATLLHEARESAENLFEEKTRKIIDEEIDKTVKDAAFKEFENRVAQFDINVLSDKVVEKVKGIITEQISDRVGDAVRDEINRRASQSYTSDAFHKTGEKAERPIEKKAKLSTEGEKFIVAEDLLGESQDKGSHELDNTFVSFEAIGKKAGLFGRRSSLLKIFVLVIAVGVLAGVVINYNIWQKIVSPSIVPVSQPMQTPQADATKAVESPSETVPAVVQPALESEAILPPEVVETTEPAAPESHAVSPEVVETTKSVAAPARVIGVTTAKALIVRQGPDKTFKEITSLTKNTMLTVVGRNADNSWLQIQIPGKTDLGWISKDFINVQGDINSLPVKMSKSSK
jgi:type II secretory pathway predicted ATPase ExeA